MGDPITVNYFGLSIKNIYNQALTGTIATASNYIIKKWTIKGS